MGIAVLAIIIIYYSGILMKRQGESIKLTGFQNGNIMELSQQSKEFEPIKQQVEELFIHANDSLKLIVTDETIAQYKTRGAIEIRYSEPREFTIQGNLNRPIKVDGLLLTFVNDRAVIFYSVNGRYSSGPLVNTADNVKDVKQYITNIAMNLD